MRYWTSAEAVLLWNYDKLDDDLLLSLTSEFIINYERK